MNYSEHISINSSIRFGNPCIKGTRITVYDVLGWLASGMTFSQILADYHELNDEQLKACLGFAADKEHKFRIAS
ncbi:MAG: DUF433 domain-containing protein [Burkholderiales bacterium]|nr:DUF433 domain-containing protein [Bacteroidia bacterium]